MTFGSSDEAGAEGVPATLVEATDEAGTVRCTACAHRCRIKSGRDGICRVRRNVDGELRLLTYGKVYDTPFGPPGTPDPVEKKPLYHFKPGTRICSFGGASCNFRCKFCQNHHLAFSGPDELTLRDVSPEEAVEGAIQQDCQGLAWTYNEPTIYAEYVRDGAQAAHEADLYTAIVTNGYFTEEFVEEVGPHLDAANVDIKGFDEDDHLQYMGAHLEPTLRGAEMLHGSDVHVELTYLTIPDLNDDPEEIRAFVEWARDELSPSVPLHFSRFHPDYEMQDRPATPIETLEMASDVATDAGMEFVYVGNVPGHESSSTRCPDCGRTWIRRSGFRADPVVDLNGRCECGREIDIVT